MRTMTLALMLATGITVFPGILYSADGGTALKLHQTGTAQPQKTVRPVTPAVEINGYCCVNGEILSSTSGECQNKSGRYYATQQAALQGCRNRRATPQKPTVKKMQPVGKAPAVPQVPKSPLKPVLIKIPPAAVTLVQGADLQTTAWNWSENPKEGAAIGAAAILNISVTNKGIETAAESRITIRRVSGPNAISGHPFDMEFDCPELAPGKSLNFAWPSYSTNTWLKGTYQFEYTIDANNDVTETNELNNQRTFSIIPERQLVDLSLFKPGEPAVIEDRITHPDAPVNFDFTVYNLTLGTTSRPVALTFTCEGQPPGVGEWGGLGGGNGGGGGCTPEGHGCQTFNFTRQWPTTGVKNCEVTVRMPSDMDGEANPDNNHANFQVHIQ